jgi:osmotically-inducible protein OsmY
MPRFGKWLLTLGLMAATPAAALSAGPFGNASPANPPAVRSNQQVAEDIAKALRGARLNRFEMDVEFANGVCTLSGKVGTPQQKAQATQVVSKVQGVTRVVNRLQSMPAPPANAFPSRQLPSAAPIAGNRHAPSAIQPAGARGGAAPVSNQKMAEECAKALKSAGLTGYDMEIRFQNGIVLLSGSISTPDQAIEVEQILARVPGVRGISNRLRVSGAKQQLARQPMPRQPMPRQPIQPAVAWQNNGGQVPVPPAYMHGGPGAQQAVYNNANLPEYAWPTYASYPNSAQITYPKQYSASAWPYIGPFYPYPQVPMGWRKASLEWDDGYWALSFNSRTDRWWWFLNPKNW